MQKSHQRTVEDLQTQLTILQTQNLSTQKQLKQNQTKSRNNFNLEKKFILAKRRLADLQEKYENQQKHNEQI